MSSSYRFYFELNEHDFKVFNSTNVLFNILIFFIIGISIYLLADWISNILFRGIINPNIILLSYISGCMNFFIQFNLNLLSAELKSKKFAFYSIFKVILDSSLSFYFIFFFALTYLARINGILISQFIIMIMLFLSVRNLFIIKFSFNSLKKSLIFSYPAAPLSIIGLLYQSFDKVMLARFRNLSTVGYYSFGEKFANIFKLTTDSITRAFNPFFQKEANLGAEKNKKNIINYFYKLSAIYILFGFIVISFSEELIKLLTTSEFYRSMYIAPIFVFYYLVGSIFGLLSLNQIMFGKKMIYQIPSSLISIFANISLNFILIPKYGAIGAVISTTVSAILSDGLLLYYGEKSFSLPYSLKKIFVMFGILTFFTAIIYALMPLDINIIIKIVIKIILILILTYLLDLKSYIESFIKNSIKPFFIR